MGSVGKSLGSIVKAVNPVNLAAGQLGAVGNLAQGKNPLDPQSIISKYGGVGAAVAAGALTPQQAQTAMYDGSTLSDFERQAGVISPKYESLRSADGMSLRKEFQMDPTKSGAFKSIRDQAMSTAPSAWAQLALQKQNLEQQNATDLASKQLQQGQSMAAGNLARIGGLGGGARTRMAVQGAKDLMLQQQGIGRQGMLDRLGISTQDEQTRQGLLKSVADTELGSQEKNLGLMTGDITNKAQFDANRYNQQMQAWGANRAANAQMQAAQSANKSKK